MATSDAPLNVPNVTLAVAISAVINNPPQSGPITVPNFGASEDPTYPLGITAGSYFVDGDNGSDTNNGIRTVDGGTGPFATVQKACSVLTAGDTCYVRQSTTTYSFLGTAYGYSGADGHRFLNSGTEGNYIRLIGYPGEKPVINQQGQTNGFHIDGKEYIQILNFEITNTFGSGVDCPNGYSIPNGHIVVKFCEIHKMDATTGDNVGCIKALGCHHVTFSDNKLHNVRVGGVLNDNGVGFSMYDTYSHKIANNEIYDVQNGVIHKTPPSGAVLTGVYRNNVFHDLVKAIYHNNNDAEPAADFFDGVYVTQNIFYNVEAAVYDTTDLALSASQSFYIFNNTLDGCNISVRGFRDIKVLNNILYGAGAGIETSYEENAATIATRHIPLITDAGHNFWDIGGGVSITLDLYGGVTKNYITLSDWQNASADNPDTLSDTNPGVGSVVGSVLFVDAATRNYKLQSGSPAINAGRDGTTIGAYITGSETIGASW